MNTTCAYCKFYDSTVGECHKSPPVRLPRRFDGQATAGNRVRNEEVIWGWPSSKPLDWCGEFLRATGA